MTSLLSDVDALLVFPPSCNHSIFNNFVAAWLWKSALFFNCDSNSSLPGNKQFFTYPTNNDKRKIWLERSRNPVLLKLSKSYLTRQVYVCSNHFRRDSFSYVYSPFKHKLKREAVPLPAITDEAPGKSVTILF